LKIRTPITVSNSDYSVPERQRIRHVLTTVKWRDGMSTRSLLADMEKQFPFYSGNTFKDQRQLTKFLEGTESDDRKIELVVQYITKNYPDLAKIITDDGNVNVTGFALSGMFNFYETKSLFDRAVDVESIRSRTGIYVLMRSAGKAGGINFIRIQHVENCPYALVRSFVVTVPPELYPKYSQKEIDECIYEISYRLSQLGGNKDEYRSLSSENIRPISLSIDGICQKYIDPILSEYLKNRPKFKNPVITLYYSGVLTIVNDRYMFFMRDVLSRSPLFAEAIFDTRAIALTNFFGVPNHIWEDGARPIFYGEDFTPLFLVDSSLSRESFELFPWRL